MPRVIREVTRPQGRRVRKQALCSLRVWDYAELVSRLAQRYQDFQLNGGFHSIKKPLLKDAKYVWPRYLDSGNPKSAKKDFYSFDLLNSFDQHYSRNP